MVLLTVWRQVSSSKQSGPQVTESDYRPSAVSLGLSGIILLSVTVTCLLVLDMTTIVNHIRTFSVLRHYLSPRVYHVMAQFGPSMKPPNKPQRPKAKIKTKRERLIIVNL